MQRIVARLSFVYPRIKCWGFCISSGRAYGAIKSINLLIEEEYVSLIFEKWLICYAPIQDIY